VWVNHKDGHTVLLEANTTTIKEDGKLVGYLSVIRDITERKKAEEALHESEQKYRTLVESAGESIATINKDGVFLFINRTGAERFGGKPKDYIGKTMWDLFPKKIADRQAAGVRKVIHTGKERNVVALTELQGQLRWYNTTIEPLRDDSGKVIAAMVIARDIHELKQAEEELNKYREQMAKAEQLASVGTLSASMAHELTQPLTVIRLSIQNSLAELEKTSCPDTVVEDLKEGLSEISGLISIIDRFRNFARISSERTVSKVDLKAVAERIVKLLDESAWRAKVTLQVDGMDKLPPIYSCERELEQLFFSLVENAIQAADGKKSRQVVISSVVKDEHIELRFSDNCSGIAPGNLDRIFEPFFTTKPIGRRTGLGLCVLERIVSRLGGKVRVESKLGKGSTFFVTLPIKGNES
jgi:PAS domain S-box-containing protein